MGYIIVLILGIVLVGILIVTLSGQGKRSMAGRLPSDHSEGVKQPAADQPNPAASNVASPSKAQAAEKHTPPA